ncbi:MAG: alpha-ketoacid dehydrogenase subunit beta [Candidatus Protistobacter heckmanni]|nr:alpha-ketoacid dehydrogenase subunit beta [Candidatus Protistobacter heckmanni]
MAARQLTFANAVNEALRQAMERDDKVICFGLGVGDPKEIFGTTKGLQKQFGADRAFDMPTSENAMTGVAIGAALQGYKPVMVHQRLDFFLLAMDQLVNNAAKWHFMFGGKKSASIVIRLVLGRGWGQGPTHSQSLHAWFAHVPGLKVLMPTTAADAKGMLLAAIDDPDPVVFLEHRWLHNTVGGVDEAAQALPLGKAKIRREGGDVTIVSMGYMTVEAIHAADFLKKHGIRCEVVDLLTISPLDWDAVMASVEKTGRILALDTGALTGSVAGEVVARVTERCWSSLKSAPARVTMPDIPEPTSFGLTKDLYPRAEHIAEKIMGMLGVSFPTEAFSSQRRHPHDVPGDWFTGPF